MLQEVLPYILINPSCLVELNLALTCRLSRSECQPRRLIVCNVYLPPSLDVNFSDLEHLIEQLPLAFVLVGDLNAHSPLWGDVRQDSKVK